MSESQNPSVFETLNKIKFKLKDNEVWFVHDVDPYGNAYAFGNTEADTDRYADTHTDTHPHSRSGSGGR